MGKEDARSHAPAVAGAGPAQRSSFAGTCGPDWDAVSERRPGLVLAWLQTVLGAVLGTGYIPIAPATFASLVALPLIWALPKIAVVYGSIVIGLYIVGGLLATSMERRWGRDARHITVDELVGMLVTMALVPFSLPSALLGFLLFRFFDIVKLPFIRAAEQIRAGWGVMTDDVLAGVCANLVLQVVFRVVWRVPAFQWRL